MAGLQRDERLQIMLTQKELEALDTWRFAARMPSRASAIRELLKRGLAAEGFAQADGQMKSADFSISGPKTIGKKSAL
jgi:hypothetical protein